MIVRPGLLVFALLLFCGLGVFLLVWGPRTISWLADWRSRYLWKWPEPLERLERGRLHALLVRSCGVLALAIALWLFHGAFFSGQ